MNTSSTLAPATEQTLHFHAPHKSPAARSTVAQRVWTVA